MRVHFVITVSIGFYLDYLCRCASIVATCLIKIDKNGSWLFRLLVHYYRQVCVAGNYAEIAYDLDIQAFNCNLPFS